MLRISRWDDLRKTSQGKNLNTKTGEVIDIFFKFPKSQQKIAKYTKKQRDMNHLKGQIKSQEAGPKEMETITTRHRTKEKKKKGHRDVE